MRGVAIVPAYNEQDAIAQVVREIRAYDSELEVVVVDDGSRDGTAEAARAAGARVLRLPFNLGIGGAVQTGFRYAFENGFDLGGARRRRRPARPVAARRGHRACAPRRDRHRRRIAVPRRVGRRLSIDRPAQDRHPPPRGTVSLLTRQRITDPTSGFQALNRKAITLFAADYPHEYPEVEALVLLVRHRLRLVEVPAAMRARETGRSSIGTLSAAYYMVKVLLALFVGTFRRYAVPLEEK